MFRAQNPVPDRSNCWKYVGAHQYQTNRAAIAAEGAEDEKGSRSASEEVD